MKLVIKLPSFAFLLCWLSATVYAVELKGVVKSETGAPLADVEILSNAPLDSLGTTFREIKTKTDKNGLFTLSDHGPVVYFKREDLNPVTKILGLSVAQVEIVMKDASSPI